MTNEHKPGTWESWEESQSDKTVDPLRERVAALLTNKKDPYADVKPEFYKDLDKVYALFQNQFGIPERVFYPCCETDATPVRAFPQSEVTLLDKNELAVNALKRNGVEALVGDVRQYRPEQRFDLLILLNPGIKAKHAMHTLKHGGYVIANDWHATTRQMLRNPIRYSFQGTVHHGKDPAELLSVTDSKDLLKKTNPFINLYSIFRKRI